MLIYSIENLYYLPVFLLAVTLSAAASRRFFSYWNLWAHLLGGLILSSSLFYIVHLTWVIYSTGELISKVFLVSIFVATLISFGFLFLELFTIANVMARKSHREVLIEPQGSLKYEPFVSIHVPTFTEPPEVVKATLEALTQLDYKNYEVLVIDNNTIVNEFWEPVRDYCLEIGPRFRFFHVDNLPGAKAGALNFALQNTDARAEIIAVIDSDYQVKPDFLKALVPHFKNPKIAIVQTPQDYRDFTPGSYAENCLWEYRYFFSFVMPSCHEYNAASFMGTMGLIRKRVLTDIKNWSEWCVTEDTELGVRTNQNQLETVYLDKSFGEGLMPFEFRDYKNQRHRWVFGNMQIIRRNVGDLFFSLSSINKLDVFQKISYLSQLTVWFNNIFLISLITLSISLAKLFNFMVPDSVIFTTLLLFIIFMSSKTLIFLWALKKKEGLNLHQACGALFSHLSLSWPMATAWWKCLFSPKGSFWRTSKEPHKLITKDRVQTVEWELLFFIAFTFLGIFFVTQEQFLIATLLLAQAALIYLPPLVAIVKFK